MLPLRTPVVVSEIMRIANAEMENSWTLRPDALGSIDCTLPSVAQGQHFTACEHSLITPDTTSTTRTSASISAASYHKHMHTSVSYSAHNARIIIHESSPTIAVHGDQRRSSKIIQRLSGDLPDLVVKWSGLLHVIIKLRIFDSSVASLGNNKIWTCSHVIRDMCIVNHENDLDKIQACRRRWPRDASITTHHVASRILLFVLDLGGL
ncbi:hypothetical protein AUEXF2481DRAFT_118620 [Aureobasidium subglaciale EXF-2481]|uniref:Uncharacterized protein n=1 Tax=Aureobasidium subglaciale (strain EXF-2481) TaxID=1043005 RepID=A0A074YVG1_AURSE|nr:uncharacterized protein AUEXF2481DRAFT_118620 [Aureobasidium subglaciale EXF-2481]KER00125.1 hypothetical protein AUEXF2481DRAFT_118620 [Aureobasidium subglaciale EXF-2481]